MWTVADCSSTPDRSKEWAYGLWGIWAYRYCIALGVFCCLHIVIPVFPRPSFPLLKKCHDVLAWNTGSALDCDMLQWLGLGWWVECRSHGLLTIGLIWCRIRLGLHSGRSLLLSDRCVVFSRRTLHCGLPSCRGQGRSGLKRRDLVCTSDDIDIIFNLSRSSDLLFSQPYDHGVGLDKLDFDYFTHMFMRMLRYFALWQL